MCACAHTLFGRDSLGWRRKQGMVRHSWFWRQRRAADGSANKGAEPDLCQRVQAIWDEDPLCWHGATRARNATKGAL